MNIFAVDRDPIKAAQMLCDQHVNKMILETAQMLSYVAARYNHPTLYRATGPHKNHPCTLWAGDSYDNWLWLVTHGLALADEKRRRTGKGHVSEEVIKYYYSNSFGPPKDKIGLTPFALAMPDSYKEELDRVVAYRKFYVGEKQFFKRGKRPTWKNTKPPSWWEFR